MSAIRRSVSRAVIVSAMAGVTFAGAGAASAFADAAGASAVPGEAASVKSAPPGRCEPWEDGAIALGPDGYLYQCELVAELGGYYWLPY